MIDLIFVACLTAAPAQCREEIMLVMPEMTLNTCTMQAQPQLASWVNTHPGYSIVRWRCSRSRDRETKA